MDIHQIQRRLVEQELDGWLLYDHHGSNRFVRDLLRLSNDLIVTRRFFYWIPAQGMPIKLIHKIESDFLSHFPGQTLFYVSWHQLQEQLSMMLHNKKRVAMEYSTCNKNPYVAAVDAGTVELIRQLGPEIVSSEDLLQQFTSVLTQQQIQTHYAAAAVLEQTVNNVWEWITKHLRMGKKITDYDVQRFILSEFAAKNCITEEGPTCAINAATALPHYMASKATAVEIQKGDFILIDLWCKQDEDYAIYADITRVAVADFEPTPKQQHIFSIVRQAQIQAIEFIQKRFANGHVVKGYEVDDVCRNYISSQGYGEYFTHRTGHNIDTQIHGAGVHLDNLETSDTRQLLPGTCFSLEPGIYLEKEFGIRLEHDVVINSQNEVEITGGTQESITCLVL